MTRILKQTQKMSICHQVLKIIGWQEMEKRRATKPPQRFDELGDSGFAFNLTEDGGFLEPTSYTEAMQDADSEFWKEAADEEIQSLDKNHTWDLVDRPEKQRVIGCKMEECKPVKTPLAPHIKFIAATEAELEEQADQMKSIPYANAVGSIMYSMIGSRPDLAHPVGVISRFMSKPLKSHWLRVKWVLRYIKGSVDSRLQYRKEGDFVVTGYCDSDHAGDHDGIPERTEEAQGHKCLIRDQGPRWKSSYTRKEAKEKVDTTARWRFVEVLPKCHKDSNPKRRSQLVEANEVTRGARASCYNSSRLET
ncbi:unnamed protein product [Arabidopsis halleri]